MQGDIDEDDKVAEIDKDDDISTLEMRMTWSKTRRLRFMNEDNSDSVYIFLKKPERVRNMKYSMIV